MIKTASLENSQRLVALGVVLDTYFGIHESGRVKKTNKDIIEGDYGWFPAPTADELGEVLRRHESIVVMKNIIEGYLRGTESLADCFINRIIYKLEQGLLTKEEVNEGKGH